MKSEDLNVQCLQDKNIGAMISTINVGKTSNCESKIAEYFRGRSVFITGATGYMGKVLVEKLLRSCPDIGSLYLLMRPRNGSSLEDRIRDFKNNVIFQRLRRVSSPNILNKLIPVPGDISTEGLGLKKKDVDILLDNVNVIFHCAASIRFDEPLKSAVCLNTRGTRDLTRLALQMKHLEAFIHVSTAFSNLDRKPVYEMVYPAREDYNYVIDCVEKMGAKELEDLSSRLLQDLPNTYVFTKSLAENVVHDLKGRLPAAIMRPSLVCPAYEEPMPGWVDSKNGPIGILIGASTGILRSAKGDGTKRTDVVPVDFSINAMIAAAWHVATTKRYDIPVFNCTTGSELSITWNQFLEDGLREYCEQPCLQVLWYPGGGIYSSALVHHIYFLILHIIPALLIDTCLLLAGKKPWLFKLQKKTYNLLRMIEFFLSNEWAFSNCNLRSLLKIMTSTDKKVFNFDATTVEYKEYVRRWIMGLRKYVLKQDDSTIPAAQSKLQRLFWLNLLLQVALYGCALWFLTTLLTDSFLLRQLEIQRTQLSTLL